MPTHSAAILVHYNSDSDKISEQMSNRFTALVNAFMSDVAATMIVEFPQEYETVELQ